MPQRKRWKTFEMPTRLTPESESLTSEYGKFIAEPFERGFATTVGNSLRRVLLSSLEGAAITMVRIEGVPHQYTTIPGVVEDVTDIILNIKRIRLRIDADSIATKTIVLNVSEPGEVTARMITTDPDVTIISPILSLSLPPTGDLHSREFRALGNRLSRRDDTIIRNKNGGDRGRSYLKLYTSGPRLGRRRQRGFTGIGVPRLVYHKIRKRQNGLRRGVFRIPEPEDKAACVFSPLPGE